MKVEPEIQAADSTSSFNPTTSRQQIQTADYADGRGFQKANSRLTTQNPQICVRLRNPRLVFLGFRV
jgi:hypothetical protein